MPREDEWVYIEVYVRGMSAQDFRGLHERFGQDSFVDMGPSGYVRRRVTGGEIESLARMGMLFHRASEAASITA